MSQEDTKWMKVRIESQGRPDNTKVFNAETGEVIHGVKSVTWHCDAGPGNKAHVILHMILPPGELTGDAKLIYSELVNKIADFVQHNIGYVIDGTWCNPDHLDHVAARIRSEFIK